MMVGFFNGMAIGAGVVIAGYFGARDMEKLRRAIHTDIAFGIIAGAVLVILGTVFTPLILRWMQTPEDVLPESIRYFRIYSLGVIFSVLYNIMMGIMNAIGDSRHPLYYLILSSIINIFLDLFLVGVVHTGVGGAAFATIMSQAVSSILCLRKLMHDDTPYRVRLRDIRIDGGMLRRIISYGLPSGIQNSVINFANIIVQTNINTFASAAVAGSGAYSKIEGFAFLPITSFSLSLTTFVGQNIGAGKRDRVLKRPLLLPLCSFIDFTVQHRSGCHLIRCQAGKDGKPFLLLPCAFTLHSRRAPRSGEGNGSHDDNARVVVHIPDDIHYGCSINITYGRACVCGISHHMADLIIAFHTVPDEDRLAPGGGKTP